MRRIVPPHNRPKSGIIVRCSRTMLGARDLPLLPVFVCVAQTGSFTAAAKKLGLGKSVVSQHIKTLEERCGVRLIERSTRSLRLTQIGEQVLEAALQVLSSVSALEQVLENEREQPNGVLRITGPIDPALLRVVTGTASELTRKYPGLKTDLIFDDAVHDLLDERFDLALRFNAPVASSYVVRRLGFGAEIIAGSPLLFAERSPGDHPSTLAGAPWVAHTGLRPRSTWTFRADDGETAQVRVELNGTTNSALALRDMLLAGAGFGVIPLHMVRDDLRVGRLQRACPRFIHRRIVLQAAMPTRKAPARVRAFLAGLSAHVSELGFES